MLAESALARVLDRLLAGQPALRARLAGFAGRHLRLQAAGLSLTLGVRDGGGLAAAPGAPADCTVTLLPAALPRLLAAAPLQPGDFRLDGDPGLAALAGVLLRQLRWDPEEALARYTGDIVAHRLARTGAALLELPRQAGRSLAAGVGEYLTEEAPVAAPRAPVEAFLREVDRLRDDLARLEARLARLDAR